MGAKKALHVFAVVSVFIHVVISSACSSDPPSTGPEVVPSFGGGSDGGPSSIDANSTTDTAPIPACNTLTLDGVAAGKARGSGDEAPAPIGGVIPDGTYVFYEAIFYGMTLPPTPFMRSKMVISGTSIQYIEGEPKAGANQTYTDTLSVLGTTLQRTSTCPKAENPVTVSFSVREPSVDASVVGDASAPNTTTLTFYGLSKGKTATLVWARE